MSAASELPSYRGLHLTFDDGPDPRWTPPLLDLLASVDARATFFMIGTQAQRNADLVRRVVRAGHAIGNHTLTHAHPWTLTKRRAIAEVRDGAAAIADSAGRAPTLFRPPHGARRQCMLRAAEAQNERIVMWDVSAIDWGWLGAAPRIARRLGRVRAGHIVLMHDGANQHNRPDQLLRALPAFLDRMR